MTINFWMGMVILIMIVNAYFQLKYLIPSFRFLDKKKVKTLYGFDLLRLYRDISTFSTESIKHFYIEGKADYISDQRNKAVLCLFIGMHFSILLFFLAFFFPFVLEMKFYNFGVSVKILSPP